MLVIAKHGSGDFGLNLIQINHQGLIARVCLAIRW
jgi:hypothetical protein